MSRTPVIGSVRTLANDGASAASRRAVSMSIGPYPSIVAPPRAGAEQAEHRDGQQQLDGDTLAL